MKKKKKKKKKDKLNTIHKLSFVFGGEIFASNFHFFSTQTFSLLCVQEACNSITMERSGKESISCIRTNGNLF